MGDAGRCATTSPRYRSPWRFLRPFLSLVAALALTLLWASAAEAAPGQHVLVSSFGSGILTNPQGIAVDNSSGVSSGDVYVASPGSTPPVIDKFGPAGNLLGTIGAANLADCAGAHDFTNPGGVAVDSVTGNVYVTDPSADEVTAFNPTGACLFQIAVGSEPFGVAVDPSHGSEGTLYVGSNEGLPIQSFNAATGTLISNHLVEAANQVDTLAVNPAGDIFRDRFGVQEYEPNGDCLNNCEDVLESSGSGALAIDPANGNVFVSEIVYGGAAHPQIGEYAPDARTPEVIFGSGEIKANVGVSGLAVNAASGRIYAADNSDGLVDVFGPPVTTPGVATEPPVNLARTSATLSGHVDPETSHGGGEIVGCHFEYVDQAEFEAHESEFDYHEYPGVSTIACSETHFSEPKAVTANLNGLTPQATYHYRLDATDECEPSRKCTTYGAVETFRGLPAVAGVTADPAQLVAPRSATLVGSFDGNSEDTHYYFEWGTEEGNFTQKMPLPPADAGSPAGPGPSEVSLDLTELAPGKLYYYRFVASNSFGTTISNEEHLSTPPAPPAVKASVEKVHSESAVLDAQVNPEGGATKYYFEYGLQDCASGPCEATAVEELEAGIRNVAVVAHIEDLTPGTTYHYRVVATNSTKTTDGPDQTFTTFPYVSKLNEGCTNSPARQQTGAALLLDCRAYELVSARNTGGYNISSDLSAGQSASFGGYPEAETPSDKRASARVLYSVENGAIPGTDHPTNRGSDPYVATRGENGWTTEYVGIPANNSFSAAPFSSTPSGANAGLETFAFGAPGGCSPCFEGGYTGIPVRYEGKLVQGMAGSLNPGPSAKPAGLITEDLSANGEHFIFGSTSQFEPEGNKNGEISIYDRNLASGETHVVSFTPAAEDPPGQPLPCHMNCSSDGIAELGISADGSHILLGELIKESEGAKLYHLYMNVGDSIRTIDLTPGASEGVRFDGMTSDGKKVFFSSTEHLTGEDEQHSGADIYMWEEGHPLTLVSTGTEGDASACDPAANTEHKHWNTTGSEENCGDLAIGGGGGVASGDGTLYFLSPSLLDGSEEPADGTKNAPNLYVVRPGQSAQFVATLESTLTGPLLSKHPLQRSFGSFASPEFAAADPSNGDVYVADTATNTISKFDSAGNLETNWRDNGKLSVGGIIGIATDPANGDLYVGEGGEIKEFTPTGTVIRNFPNGTYGYAHGIAVDAAGNVYVYDSFYHYIEKLSSTGESLRSFSNINATGIAVDPSNGDLYLDDEGNSIVRYSFNGSGELIGTKTITSEIANAKGLAVDAAHDIYIDEGSQVLELNSSGEEVSVQLGTGLLHGSAAVAAGSAGEVYVANPSHSNLVEFGPPQGSPNPKTDNPAVVDALSEPESRRSADFQLTPSGQFAAFTSTLPLTGAENARFPEVYRYDAAAKKLDCASCNPSDAEATGGASLAADGSSLTEAGQVFFNSEEALALPDSDNLTDVYEWEPAGTGTCSSNNPNYSKGSGNCVGLISSGTSPFNSKLLGVSMNGTDAYFFTRDSLAPQDENGELVKVYDAREEGGFFVTPEPPPCHSSDECHGAGSSPPPPPDFHPNPGTGGNEVEIKSNKCAAGLVKKSGKCVKKPKHHRSTKNHRRAHHGRGGKK